MRARRTAAALLCALVACSAPATGALAAPVAPATPTPTIAGTQTHAVPPQAPRPTDHANSPAAPDPHPPRGGRGPFGEAVGGARLLGRGLVLPHGAPALPKHLTAQAWMLTDLDTGAILAARDPHGRYQPASIQKLLTTVTLLPRLPGDRVVTVSRRSANTEGSHAGLVAGGRYTIDQIFEGLLLVSGNDAAEALAEAAGGRAPTVAMMNRAARELGAYDTYVQTPSGLDGWAQLTSAYDMTLFLRAALDQPRFVHYDTVDQAVLPKKPVVGRVHLYNQNVDFLHTVPGALVAKTGFTDAAQHTFVGAIRRHGHRYGVVLMRAQRYPQDQWVQATALVRWGLTLPAGTRPVGTLDAAAVRPPPATTGAPRSASASAGPAATRASDDSSDAVPVALVIIGILLVAGGGLLIGRGRRAG